MDHLAQMQKQSSHQKHNRSRPCPNCCDVPVAWHERIRDDTIHVDIVYTYHFPFYRCLGWWVVIIFIYLYLYIYIFTSVCIWTSGRMMSFGENFLGRSQWHNLMSIASYSFTSCGHVFVQAKWRTACVKFLQWRFWQGEGWKSIHEAHSMTWAGSWPSTPCYAGHRPLVSHTWHVHAT